MNVYDIVIVMFFVVASGAAYVAYWAGYCWVMRGLWPTGPAWLVCPKVWLFLAVCITGLILTLLIFRAAR